MSSIVSLPRRLSRRYARAATIRKFDRNVDEALGIASGALAASPLAQGYMAMRIDELIGQQGFTEQMRGSELRKAPEAGSRIHLTWDLPAFLWEGVLGSESLNRLVASYLGPRARLDDLYVKTVQDGLKSGSEGWHDDNVGYRLKVFMVFDTEGTPSGTIIIPASRPKIYAVSLMDELVRMLGRPDLGARDGQLRVDYTAGDCLVFDTNLAHRGDYSSTSGIRYCVIAEYIDREKADALVGKAPCGPGQGKRRIAIPRLDGIDLAAHPLMDPRLLTATPDGYLYGYPKA